MGFRIEEYWRSFGPDLVMRVRMMGCCGWKRREEMRIIKGNGEMCA